MRKATSFLLFVVFCNLLIGQDIVKLSGKIELVANPCLTEICLPGLVWSLKTDTASFVLTKYHNWIWTDDSVVVDGFKYSENDTAKIYGQFSIKNKWDGSKFYEFEIINTERRDTTIKANSTLKLVFAFHIFECGINVFKYPIHQSICQLDYNTSSDTATFTYKPKQDFIGTDTVLFLTGCGSSFDNMIFKIIEYKVNISDNTLINNRTIDSDYKIFPNPSTGLIKIIGNNYTNLEFILCNSIGQEVLKGKLQQDFQLDLENGVYIFTIIDKAQLIYRQKIIIKK